METKFTQGEWEIRPTTALNENGRPLFYDITVDGSGFLSTYKNMYIDGLYDEQQLANAKLIAAAPEMFEMLQKLIVTFSGQDLELYQVKRLEEAEQLLTKITQ